MTNNATKKVDALIRASKTWQEESELLRAICLDCDLTEEVKWRKPCYTFEGSNIVIIQGFKQYCALMFFKGALLKDPQGLLVAPGENSQAARQLRFTGAQEISKHASTIRAYILEAIEIEKAGLTVEFKETDAYEMPEELITAFENDPELEAAFGALTPGRQRGYMLHFSSAKQSKTRQSRIEKSRPKILAGKGFNER